MGAVRTGSRRRSRRARPPRPAVAREAGRPDPRRGAGALLLAMVAVTVVAQVVTRLVGGAPMRSGSRRAAPRAAAPRRASGDRDARRDAALPVRAARRLRFGDAVAAGSSRDPPARHLGGVRVRLRPGRRALRSSTAPSPRSVFLYSVYLYASALLFGAEVAAAWSAPPGRAGRADPPAGARRRLRAVRAAEAAAASRAACSRCRLTNSAVRPTPEVQHGRRRSRPRRARRGGMPRSRRSSARSSRSPGSPNGTSRATREPASSRRTSADPALSRRGVERISSLELPNTAPILTGEIPARTARRRCSSTGTTTSCPPATRASGSRRRSRRASATARSTGAARPTRSRTSSSTSVRSALGRPPPVGSRSPRGAGGGRERARGGVPAEHPSSSPRTRSSSPTAARSARGSRL
jgi:hypothetical protein